MGKPPRPWISRSTLPDLGQNRVEGQVHGGHDRADDRAQDGDHHGLDELHEAGHRDVHLVALDTEVNTPIYDASALTHQHKILGPAIVTTENTTYLVEPGWRLEPTPQGAVWFLRD